MNRQIVCFQIPCLQIELARLDEPSLKHRPVAVAHPYHRSFLAEVSWEAARAGIYPGMPARDARRVCPLLRIVPPDSRRVRLAHESVIGIARQFTPICEPVTAGHFYMDLTGTARIFGCAVDTAARMEREIRKRSRLAAVMGVATNKLVSGIAAMLIRRPPHLYDICPGTERRFLAPLPVIFLPGLKSLYASRTVEILTHLEDLNLDTLGKIAGIPVHHLGLVLGPQAILVRQWALGIDPTPVWPSISRPSLEISHTFSPHEIDDGAVLAVLHSLLERLCRRLRLERRAGRRIKLDLVHSDGVEVTRQRLLARCTCWEADIYPNLREIFLQSFKRRVRLRQVTLSVDRLESMERQMSLFSQERSRTKQLSVTLDSVRARYGEHAIAWGR